MAKQKLKGYYGNIGEKQFKKYYTAAVRKKGDTGANLIGILECRLDAILYRMKLAPTVFACRQLINHGHVMVNGSRCNIPSRMINVGEVISLKDKAKNIPAVIEATTLPERDVPEYIQLDSKNKTTKLVRVPKFSEIPYPVERLVEIISLTASFNFFSFLPIIATLAPSLEREIAAAFPIPSLPPVIMHILFFNPKSIFISLILPPVKWEVGLTEGSRYLL